MSALTRQELIEGEVTNGYLYLGRNNIASEVVFSSRPTPAGDHLALVDNRSEDILLRGVFAIDPTWSRFTPDGNISAVSKPGQTKATCYLKEVPKKFKKYAYAREDFLTACNNLRAIMDKVRGLPLDRTKSMVQAIGDSPQHDAIKLSHSLFQRLPPSDEDSDEEEEVHEPTDGAGITEESPAEFDFGNWPISDGNRRKFEAIGKSGEWKIIPIPVFRRVDGEWTLVHPEDYMSLLPNCIVDVSFVVANWNITKKGEVDRSFNAIPACIRILSLGHSTSSCSPEIAKRARDTMLTSDTVKQSRVEGTTAVTDTRTHLTDELATDANASAASKPTNGEAIADDNVPIASTSTPAKRKRRTYPA